jgi:hypothetical protein
MECLDSLHVADFRLRSIYLNWLYRQTRLRTSSPIQSLYWQWRIELVWDVHSFRRCRQRSSNIWFCYFPERFRRRLSRIYFPSLHRFKSLRLLYFGVSLVFSSSRLQWNGLNLRFIQIVIRHSAFTRPLGNLVLAKFMANQQLIIRYTLRSGKPVEWCVDL